MLMIAVCDDEQKINAELESDLINILANLNIKSEIDVYFSGSELCGKIASGTYYDLIFLDIEFAKNEINGVEVGRFIRDTHQNNTVSIVYISWEKKYSMQLFDIRPLNFLIKPLMYEKIEQVVKTFLKISGLRTEVFIYKSGHDTCKVQMKDIVFVESNDRKLILHIIGGRKEEFYGALRDVYEQQLKKFDFLFIHASYVVNYDHVTAIKYSQLFLTDNKTPIPISQNKRNEVRERYYEIMKRRNILL